MSNSICMKYMENIYVVKRYYETHLEYLEVFNEIRKQSDEIDSSFAQYEIPGRNYGPRPKQSQKENNDTKENTDKKNSKENKKERPKNSKGKKKGSPKKNNNITATPDAVIAS